VEDAVPRIALAVRAGDEVLGFIWAAKGSSPTPEWAATFRDVGRLVALHLLRDRAGVDDGRRLRAELVGAALEGGPRAREAARRLGTAHRPVIVFALARPERLDPAAAIGADRLAGQRRVIDAFETFLAAAHPNSATALIGDVGFGILPVIAAPDDAEQQAVRLGADFLGSMGTASDVVIGVGPVAMSPSGLPASRDGAVRALRVLSRSRTSRRVAAIGEVGIDALMIELADLAALRGDTVVSPVARLVAYDTRNAASLVSTLRAWLDTFGDVGVAAQSMNVHPNTFRYRLRRLSEVAEVDLEDAGTRFSLMLQLRLMSDA
jgi:hypothetical protein